MAPPSSNSQPNPGTAPSSRSCRDVTGTAVRGGVPAADVPSPRPVLGPRPTSPFAAVDVQHRTSRVRRRRAGEVEDGSHDLVRVANPAERELFEPLVHPLPVPPRGDVRLERP